MLRAYLVLLTLLLGKTGCPQTLPPSIDAFPSDEHRVSKEVSCVLPLSKGKLAFGGSGKVHIYDGERFRGVSLPEDRSVHSMDQGEGGRIFVGGKNLMGVLFPDSSGVYVFRSLKSELPDSLQNIGVVLRVHCLGKGRVLFNALDHLFVVGAQGVKVIEPEERFFKSHTLGNGPIVQNAGVGFCRYEDSGLKKIPGTEKLASSVGVHAILPSAKGEGWVLYTRRNGFLHYDSRKDSVTRFEVKEGRGGAAPSSWSDARVFSGCRMDPDKNPFRAAYAVGTALKGIYLFSADGRIVLHLDREEGLPSESVWDLSSTENGDLWAATGNGPVLLHTGLPFTKLEEGSSFQGSISAISRFPGEQNSFFLATPQGTWAWDRKERGLRPIQGTQDLCYDLLPIPSKGDGEAYFSKHGPGMMGVAGRLFRIRRKEGAWWVDTNYSKRFYEASPLPPVPKEEVEGGQRMEAVLLAAHEGLFVFGMDEMEEDMFPGPLLAYEDFPEGILSVAAERKGKDSLKLWGGTSTRGVIEVSTDSSYEGYHVSHYDTSDGLPEGKVRVFQDPSGTGVLFGTSEGLFQRQNGRFKACCRYGPAFCQKDRTVQLLTKGMNEEVWIADAGGSLALSRSDKDRRKLDSTLFRALDIGRIGAVHSEEGKRWIGGEQGLVRYDPGTEHDKDREWWSSIREVRGVEDTLLFGGVYSKAETQGRSSQYLQAFGDRRAVNDQPKGMRPRIPYRENRIEFRYAAPFTDRQEAVRYSYKLEGFDTAWSDWEKKNRKEYTNLHEGSYCFKVKARNVYLKESQPASYRFRVLPPWYRTWPAYGGFTAMGGAFLWFLLWLNGRRLRAQKEKLTRIVEERTQEIREQKELVEGQKKEIEEAHREITSSIDYAQKIQNALLQSEEHVSEHLPEHFILFKPQATVSGDFYWAKERNGYLYFAAVDCTGHGVPGAFMSMLGISQLNEIMASKELPTPGEILTDLRQRVVAELSTGDPEGGAKDGMDAAVVKIPLENADPRTIQFAGANNPLYVVKEEIGAHIQELSFKDLTGLASSDRIKPFKKSSDGLELKGDKMAVGYEPDAAGSFTTLEIEIPSESMLYLSSDGFADQFGGPKGKKFRYGPFKELLVQLHRKRLSEQKEALDRTFEEWKEESGQEQVDDVLVIGIAL